MSGGKVGILLAILLLGASSARAEDPAFNKGAWSLELTGAYITPIRFSADRFYNANLAASVFIVDHLSIAAEIQGYYVDQPDEDAIAGGVGVVGRWHFMTHGDFTLFIDAGGGVVMADPEVPEFGTHFNFTGKGGFGATWRLRDDVHLIGGVRYFHLSNGDIHGRDQNPSYDGIQLYAGVVFSF